MSVFIVLEILTWLLHVAVLCKGSTPIMEEIHPQVRKRKKKVSVLHWELNLGPASVDGPAADAK